MFEHTFLFAIDLSGVLRRFCCISELRFEAMLQVFKCGPSFNMKACLKFVH